MKSLPLLVIAVLCYIAAAEEPQGRLEITEYRLPKVERIQGDSVIGYWEPGWMEFEAYVGKPTRDLLGIHTSDGTRRTRDTLLQVVGNPPQIKGRPFKPAVDIHGNVWTRKVTREQWSCDKFSLCRNDTVVYQFRDCVGAEDPFLFIRGDDWWIESWAYREADDTSARYTPTRGFQIIVNGKFLSDTYHCSGTFEYHFVGDKPFFLFSRDSSLGWNYDGVETVSSYDDFFHGHCCEPATSDPRFLADEFSFYARRDSIWYLVAGRIVQ